MNFTIPTLPTLHKQSLSKKAHSSKKSQDLPKTTVLHYKHTSQKFPLTQNIMQMLTLRLKRCTYVNEADVKVHGTSIHIKNKTLAQHIDIVNIADEYLCTRNAQVQAYKKFKLVDTERL